MVIKVIAFDLDDTLWAVKPVIIRAEQRLDSWLKTHVPELRYDVHSMRELRHELLRQEPELGKKITELRRRIIQQAMRMSDISSRRATHLANEAIEVFLAARNDIQFFAGALASLEELSKRYVLGALSNGNADIRRIGLEGIFTFAFSAETVGAPKPDPRLFHAALAHTRTQPTEMVYVGDDPKLDIDAAKRVGLHTIWMKNPERIEAGETVADEAIDDISDLPAAVNRLHEKVGI